MISAQTNKLQNQPVSFLTAEMEVMVNIDYLRGKITRSEAMIPNLEGLLCAHSHRNKEINRLACLREELRKWHIIRHRVANIQAGQGSVI